MSTNPLVSCVQASRTYGRDRRAVVAVHDVTVDLLAGARVALVGPSGSGKSTLLQLLAGLDEPTRGTVTWPGLGGRPQDDASLVGVVFQGPSLIPALTARENVALPLVLRGVRQAEAEGAALEAMERLGIAGVGNQLPDELSGGQSQRVAVARVLTTRPRLILADEPTGRLDQQAGHLVVDVLVAAADELDAALVVTTHDPHVSSALATHWRMRDGALEQLATSRAGR